MNRAAIVLAADSTVTIKVNGGKVHYPGVEKIFGLSHLHSVGVMVNGASYFFGIPWEVMIKTYRTDMLSGSKVFNKLEEYVDSFVKFLIGFHKERIDYSALQVVAYEKLHDQMLNLRQEFKRSCSELLRRKFKDIEDQDNSYEKMLNEYISHLKEEIEKHIQYLIDGGHNLDEFFSSAKGLLKNKKLKELSKEVFGRAKIDDELLLKIFVICGVRSAFIPDENDVSTIVICGYGSDEYSPTLVEIEVRSILGIRFQASIGPKVVIDASTPADFRVFGESEIAEMFLTGISKQFINDFKEEFKNKLSSHPKIAKKFPFDIIHNVSDIVQESVRKQIIKSVAHLPKHFLGNMAEKLITLSSIKSHVKDVDGSVGGPVSVAIISKGDGLVWINRPHYFDVSKNPHFLARYHPVAKHGAGSSET